MEFPLYPSLPSIVQDSRQGSYESLGFPLSMDKLEEGMSNMLDHYPSPPEPQDFSFPMSATPPIQSYDFPEFLKSTTPAPLDFTYPTSTTPVPLDFSYPNSTTPAPLDFSFPISPPQQDFMFQPQAENQAITMISDGTPFDDFPPPFMVEPSPVHVSPASPAMDWELLSPISPHKSESGPVRRKSSIASVKSAASDAATSITNSITRSFVAKVYPKKIMSCRAEGCFATFSKLKHLKRHALKHGEHNHRCVNAGCMVTSYRSDMMKAHIKNCSMEVYPYN